MSNNGGVAVSITCKNKDDFENSRYAIELVGNEAVFVHEVDYSIVSDPVKLAAYVNLMTERYQSLRGGQL